MANNRLPGTGIAGEFTVMNVKANQGVMDHTRRRGSESMKHLAAFVLGLGLCVGAQADVWKWVDALGEVHFVDSETAIYTWVDEFDKVHYSDKPGSKDAFRVQLLWVSAGSNAASGEESSRKTEQTHAVPGETAEEASERKTAEAYYCKRAREIYATVTEAERLYDTDAEGKRVFLTEEESAQTIAEAKANKDEWCP